MFESNFKCYNRAFILIKWSQTYNTLKCAYRTVWVHFSSDLFSLSHTIWRDLLWISKRAWPLFVSVLGVDAIETSVSPGEWTVSNTPYSLAPATKFYSGWECVRRIITISDPTTHTKSLTVADSLVIQPLFHLDTNLYPAVFYWFAVCVCVRKSEFTSEICSTPQYILEILSGKMVLLLQ